MSTTYLLKDRFFYDQKKIANPDGTNNMDRHKEYGRFNLCFICSSTASLNQSLTRLRDNGVEPIGSFKKALYDPVAYRAIILSRLNAKIPNAGAWKENSQRYVWAEHQKELNTQLKNCFVENVPGKYVLEDANPKKIVQVLDSKYQPIVGIWIGDYYSGGNGHVTTCVGYKVSDSGELLGLIFADPAGQLNGKGSYRNDDLSGEQVFYGKEMFPKIFRNNRKMLYFKENV